MQNFSQFGCYKYSVAFPICPLSHLCTLAPEKKQRQISALLRRSDATEMGRCRVRRAEEAPEACNSDRRSLEAALEEGGEVVPKAFRAGKGRRQASDNDASALDLRTRTEGGSKPVEEGNTEHRGPLFEVANPALRP
jgi:hypothetical protein